MAAIAELARVLKPGGRLLFIEHVRSDDPGRARWQDRFEKPWRFMADGCYCNRDTEANLRSSSFQVEAIEHGKMPKAMPIVRPLIRGSAILATTHDLTLAAQFSDRLTLLAHGVVVASGPPDEVLEEGSLDRHFGTQVRILRTEDGELVVVPRRVHPKGNDA